MGLAETAELITVLKLRDQLSGPMRTATGNVRAAEAGLGRLSTATRTASGHMMTFGGALGHAKGAIGGLLSGPLGLIGLGAGVFSLGKFFEDSVREASDFALATSKVASITGMAIEPTSALLAVLGKFGIEGSDAVRVFGMMERNLGNLTKTTATAKDFQKQFGISLVDAKGHAKDANTVILQQADYFNNKLIPASTKAAEMAKVFGRQWQTLIPVMQLGSKGILEAEAAARELGLTINKDNVGALKNFRTAQLDFGEALKALKLQAGVTIVPLLTDAARGLAAFLKNGGIKQITSALKDAIGFVRTFASVAGTVFTGLKTGWDAVPPELRQFLLTAFVANKALKFTFGFSGIDLLKQGLGGGGLFGRGSSPFNPLWVKDATGGVGGAGGLPGGLSLAGIITSVIGGLAVAGAFKVLIQDPALNAQQNDVLTNAKRQLASNPSAMDLDKGLRAIRTGLKDLAKVPGSDQLYPGQKTFLLMLEQMYVKALQKTVLIGPKATVDARNKRDALATVTPSQLLHAVKNGVVDGNRNLPSRRDLAAGTSALGRTIFAAQAAITSAERSGLAAVTSAVWAVEAAVRGVPWAFGTAGDIGRGTGPNGRPRTKFRDTNDRNPRTGFNLNVTTNVDHRTVKKASVISGRWGPTPADAGAI